MLFTPATSYIIISSNDRILSYVLDYILYINASEGIYQWQSFSGKTITISNDKTPSKNSVVISTIQRDGDFMSIDLDNITTHAFFEIHNKECAKATLNAIQKEIQSMTKTNQVEILLQLVSKENITTQDALDLVANVKNLYYQKIQALIYFVKSPTIQNIINLNSFYDSDKELLMDIASLLYKTPQWISKKYYEVLQSKIFISHLLVIARIALKAKDLHYFNLATLSHFKAL